MAGICFLFLRSCNEDMEEIGREMKVQWARLQRYLSGMKMRGRVTGCRRRAACWLREHPKIRIGIFAGITFALLLVAFSGFVLTQTPSREELTTIKNAVASEVYSADSVLLGRYYIQDRTEVKYEDISPHLISALVATEDVRFYRHHGIDYRSLGRVLVRHKEAQ